MTTLLKRCSLTTGRIDRSLFIISEDNVEECDYVFNCWWQVAILCNHQRAVPKTHEKSMANLEQKIKDKKKELKEAKVTYTYEIYYLKFKLCRLNCLKHGVQITRKRRRKWIDWRTSTRKWRLTELIKWVNIFFTIQCCFPYDLIEYWI